MRTIDLDSWDDLPRALADLRDELGAGQGLGPERQFLDKGPTLLFRGHTDSEWGLRTTLERWSDREYTVQEYLRRARSCVNEIESVTGREWHLRSFAEIEEEIVSQQTPTKVHLPHYDFLIYLRHHGFPSPLLDWTTSPYVAAYFAFEQQSEVERCGLFAFVQQPSDEGEQVGERLIQTQGPKVTAHVRHFSQKAWYTTSTRWDEEHQTHTFAPHLPSGEDAGQKDLFLRITLPRRDRLKALRNLEEYNINHFTLYQTDDALIRTMTLRTFVLAEG